jgi:hypothetical protein
VPRPLRVLLAAPLLVAGLAGCGADAVSAGRVADDAETALEEQAGVRPDISCPEDLAAEVGAETRCTLTAGEDPTEYGVTVTVTAVEDEGPTMEVEVDDAPLDDQEEAPSSSSSG